MPVAAERETVSQDCNGQTQGLGGAAPLHVLVVSPDDAERARLVALIGATPGMRVSDGLRRSARAGQTTRPDVLLLHLDPHAPGMERRLREVLAAWRPAPVLVLSESPEGVVNREFVRKGARGVVPKSSEQNHLVAAIRRLRDGEIWLSRGCLSTIIDEMAAGREPQAGVRPRDPFASLTGRERDVVSHVAEGLHNRAIAVRLGVSENTVRHHLTTIYGKLGVAGRLELAVYALRHRAAGGGRH